MTIEDLAGRSADPENALRRATTVLEAAPPDVRDRLSHGDAAGRLVLLCAGAPALAEALRADPAHAAFVAAPDAAAPPDMTALAAEIRALGPAPSLAPLRRLRRREAIRSALRHLAAAAPIETLAAEVSRVADLVARTVIEWTTAGLGGGPVGGAPPIAVVALGKWGGEELNFDSDIDLFFISGPGADLSPHVERLTRLAERTVVALSEAAPEGALYRVDTRLRPDGSAGALVRTLDSYVRYYLESGATWERQALIKARPVAGDGALGARFVEAIEPFVWRRYLDRDSVEAIEEIKGKIEARTQGDAADRDVKRGFGGIREIEFIVQILQLANGGRNAEVRARGTLPALAALVGARYLDPEEADGLAAAYRFLRRVEHILQISAGGRRHHLPETEAGIDLLARRLGAGDGEAFLETYRETTRGVRAAYERLFSRAGRVALASDEWRLADALDEADAGDAEAAATDVARLGFADGPASLRALRTLARGTSLDRKTSAIRRQFLRLSADLLPRLRSTPDPDRTAANLARLVEAYGARAPLYDVLLARPAVLDLFVRVAASAALLVDRLQADPSNIEALLAPASLAFERPPEDLVGRYEALVEMGGAATAFPALHAEEILRIGARHVLGLDSPETTARALADLADFVVARALEEGDDLAVLAAGKLGARDLRYLSDLDLVFVAADASAGEAAARARRLIERLAGPPALYAVDARLRPWGRSAPLVVGLSEFRRYLAAIAEPWERLVWFRGRLVAGDPDVAGPALEAVSTFTARPLAAADIASIRSVRGRIVETATDPKRGPGGTMALEFLRAAASIGGGDGRLPPPLEEAERFFRAAEAAVQMTTGRPWRAPLSARARAVAAPLAGCDPAAFEEILARHRATVAAAFEKRFGR